MKKIPTNKVYSDFISITEWKKPDKQTLLKRDSEIRKKYKISFSPVKAVKKGRKTHGHYRKRSCLHDKVFVERGKIDKLLESIDTILVEMSSQD